MNDCKKPEFWVSVTCQCGTFLEMRPEWQEVTQNPSKFYGKVFGAVKARGQCRACGRDYEIDLARLMQ